MQGHSPAARGAGWTWVLAARPLLIALLHTGVLAAGCTHSARAARAHLAALHEALEAHAFPLSPGAARERLQLLGMVDAVVGPVVEQACGAEDCRVRLGMPGRDELLLGLAGPPSGPTRVQVLHVPAQRGQVMLALVWRALDAQGLEEALAEAGRAAGAASLAEWRTFRPRWAPSGAAYYASGARQAGFGVRVGVRYWREPHLLAGALVEYEWGLLSPSPSARSAPVQTVGLPLRVELAPWTAFSEAHGLPDASFFLSAGPTLLLPSALAPAAVPGFRAGLGVQLLHASDGVMLPLLVEAQLQHHALAGGPVRDLRLLVGVGF